MDKYSRWHDNAGSDEWADEAIDFLFDHGLCAEAMAWALGIKGEFDADSMQRTFESLPEYENGRNITQEEIAESYIEFFGLDEKFDQEWAERNGGNEE